MSQREAQFVVCVDKDPKMFKDNKKGPCSNCGKTVYWRPQNDKRGPKVCIACAEKLLAESTAVEVEIGGYPEWRLEFDSVKRRN